MTKEKTPAVAVANRSGEYIRHTADIVSAYLSRNQLMPTEVPAFIKSVHGAVAGSAGDAAQEADEAKPAISIKKSVTDEYLVCLHDGKKLTMLKRYLRTHYNQSPEDYRRQYGLMPDYPMVAPAYARLRSAFAKKIGLGRVPGGGRPKKK